MGMEMTYFNIIKAAYDKLIANIVVNTKKVNFFF